MITPDFCREAGTITDIARQHCGYFDLDGQTVRVALPTREAIENLRSFFFPYITSQDGAQCSDISYELIAVVEPELYDHIAANIPPSPEDVLPAVLKHDVEYRLGCFYAVPNEITIIEDQPLKLFYLISERGRATKVVGTVGSRIQTGLLRILRALWVLSYDALIVHGCALEKHGRGLIIAGEKHAGKTTSLLNLCSRKNYDIVANDRLLLQSNDPEASLRAIGVPTVVNVRWDTVKPFPELKHLINLRLFGVCDLARTLNVEVKRDAKISAVVFLSYDHDLRRPVFHSLSPDESYAMLVSQLMSRREYEWVRIMNFREAGPLGIGIAKEDLISRVSCFQLTGNETQLEELAIVLDDWCQVGSGSR
jgi:hypothetical protein